ncbi:MAG: helix-turn-helix domain-containing protein, partial [Rhodothermales bacterium]|nr:helix-turn-helix domain-containing protein [Rhodothermales bacterium]
FASDGHIDASALREALEAGPSTLYTSGTAAETGLAELKAACRAHRGNPSEIARALRLGRSTLYRRLREAGIDLQDYR